MTTARCEIDTFTWKNLGSDAHLALHAQAMSMYLNQVILPALDALDAQLKDLSQRDDVVVEFILADLNALQSSTVQAFALTIQAQWERQIRAFIKDCASSLGRLDKEVQQVERLNWSKLVAYFESLRGIPMLAFDSFRALDQLQLLGNACRHGDGSSARELYKQRPDLWPELPTEIQVDGGGIFPLPETPSFSLIDLRRSHLVEFTMAVIWFWEDHEYIYINSIERKHPSALKALADMRKARAGRRLSKRQL